MHRVDGPLTAASGPLPEASVCVYMVCCTSCLLTSLLGSEKMV